MVVVVSFVAGVVVGVFKDDIVEKVKAVVAKVKDKVVPK